MKNTKYITFNIPDLQDHNNCYDFKQIKNGNKNNKYLCFLFMITIIIFIIILFYYQ